MCTCEAYSSWFRTLCFQKLLSFSQSKRCTLGFIIFCQIMFTNVYNEECNNKTRCGMEGSICTVKTEKSLTPNIKKHGGLVRGTSSYARSASD